MKKIESRLEDKELLISKQQENISILTQQNQNLSMNEHATPHRPMSSSSLPPSSPIHIPLPLITQPIISHSPQRATSKRNFSDDSKALAEARAQVAMLEQALEQERAARRETDSEVIKLRAQANGVHLGEDELKALLPSDEYIKSSVVKHDVDPIGMHVERQNTSDTIESDDR